MIHQSIPNVVQCGAARWWLWMWFLTKHTYNPFITKVEIKINVCKSVAHLQLTVGGWVQQFLKHGTKSDRWVSRILYCVIIGFVAFATMQIFCCLFLHSFKSTARFDCVIYMLIMLVVMMMTMMWLVTSCGDVQQVKQ